MDQPAWNRSEGRDHILPVHHPWSFKSVRKFMKKATWLLPDMDSTGNWLISSLLICTTIEYYCSSNINYCGCFEHQVQAWASLS